MRETWRRAGSGAHYVIPAKAGIQFPSNCEDCRPLNSGLDSRFRGNDPGYLAKGRRKASWPWPRTAGMAGFAARFRSYSSTLASSINITGMSSLMG